jgi:hypothetical protein
MIQLFHTSGSISDELAFKYDGFFRRRKVDRASQKLTVMRLARSPAATHRRFSAFRQSHFHRFVIHIADELVSLRPPHRLKINIPEMTHKSLSKTKINHIKHIPVSKSYPGHHPGAPKENTFFLYNIEYIIVNMGVSPILHCAFSSTYIARYLLIPFSQKVPNIQLFQMQSLESFDFL